MTACELCSGRHATSACASGLVFVEQCFAGTPDDFTSPRYLAPEGMMLLEGSNVIPLFTDEHNHRRTECHRLSPRFTRSIANGDGYLAQRLG